MNEKKDNVLQAIRELMERIGNEIYSEAYNSPEKKLHLGVHPKEDDNNRLSFTVTIGSSDFEVTFQEKDDHKICGELKEMLDFIEDCLVNRYGCGSRIE